MPLLTLRGVVVSFGGPNLLDGIDLQIDAGERVCLVGRNGAGKSTLMKLIIGEHKPDDGTLVREQGLRSAYLTQEVPADLTGAVYDVVADGLGHVGRLLADYHQISHQLATDYDEKLLNKLSHIQHDLEASKGWELGQQVDATLSRLQLPADELFENLSGGLKRRVLLARALVTAPDLLLLDEPTNHLDIEAIAWLEEFLKGWRGALLFITHDRQFLRNVATRIIEIDRGRLTSWPGDYDTYLRRKQEVLEAEDRQNAEFDKKLALEERWIRQGIKARRTRNEGRVRALEALREEYGSRRNRSGQAKMSLNQGESSGKLVVECEGLNYSYGDNPIVKGLTTTLMRGDRVGLIGPNGVGKTTLIKLLLGQLPPDSGTLRMGTKLEVAYFDQHRAILDPDSTVLDNLAEGSDTITINGRSRHIMSYLQDFLFAPDRVRAPVRSLSGGERNRLLLAKLFAKPFNLLVLDEPTNDLDVETLELLEELILDYTGTLLLVSHDRAFINNVVTSTLVFEGNGAIGEYVGGYDDWLRQRTTARPLAATTSGKSPIAAKSQQPATPQPRKLSYKLQRELEELPAEIERLEQEQESLHQVMASPDYYQQDAEAMAAQTERLAVIGETLTGHYRRWEELEELEEPSSEA